MDSAFKTLGAAKARVTRVELPKRYEGLLAAHWTVFCFELFRSFADEYYRAGEKLSESLRERWVEGSRISAETYLDAMALGQACRAALPEAFGDCDVLVVPSAPGEAPKGLAITGNPVMNQIWSFLHTPAVTVPVAKGPNGLPVGLQIIGRSGEDWKALAAAQWIHRTLT
jgi:Asp-tRNA(Asn)/Glu-tRNA(Gln) amidotransferase A subunit family amidase